MPLWTAARSAPLKDAPSHLGLHKSNFLHSTRAFRCDKRIVSFDIAYYTKFSPAPVRHFCYNALMKREKMTVSYEKFLPETQDFIVEEASVASFASDMIELAERFSAKPTFANLYNSSLDRRPWELLLELGEFIKVLDIVSPYYLGLSHSEPSPPFSRRLASLASYLPDELQSYYDLHEEIRDQEIEENNLTFHLNELIFSSYLPKSFDVIVLQLESFASNLGLISLRRLKELLLQVSTCITPDFEDLRSIGIIDELVCEGDTDIDPMESHSEALSVNFHGLLPLLRSTLVDLSSDFETYESIKRQNHCTGKPQSDKRKFERYCVSDMKLAEWFGVSRRTIVRWKVEETDHARDFRRAAYNPVWMKSLGDTYKEFGRVRTCPYNENYLGHQRQQPPLY